ncbi:TonB-dependent hemoglobin/transferrin/lactoferrin family receptor [Vibrio sp. T187]|uniref:TonB-dependent hemoglobin/transferrin/lactoferrin family receptor n=1 Tax=Vibrio TaxID=662 RepID=UPI0010C9BFED|nr:MULTISPECIES: TonB-dependent hemoglobin/transferrin/lactoferrin family receptor [Vibrio]MBW3695455.1 TonB-dependent hemoglobin/transferrin/lactoferrin family receptor [Vibrio sp. T187]
MKLSPISAAVLSVLAANFVHAKSEVSQFEEVVVTANKIEQPLSEVAGSIAVIDGETLEKKGATELYDSLKGEPGVSVTGGAGRPQNITIRGMTGNRIAIVKDGVKSSDGFGASDINDKVGRNSFDLSNVKSIEVVKGASSSLHGSGAIGGVVIIETKRPEDFLQGKDFYSDVSGTYSGISNKYKGASNLAFRAGDTESLINVAYWTGEETRNFDQDLYIREVKGMSGTYTVNHYWSDALMLKAKLDYFKNEQDREEGSASIQKDGIWNIDTFDEYETTEQFGVLLGVEYESDSAWFNELDATVYMRDTQTLENTNRLMWREENNQLRLRRTIEQRDFHDELMGSDFDFLGSANWFGLSHEFAYGFSATTSRYERPSNTVTMDWNGVVDENKKPFAPAREYSFGSYISDMIELQEWTLSGALRFDIHSLQPDQDKEIEGYEVKDMNSSELSPSLSAAYYWTDSLNTYVSYNHGYRAPAYDKAYGYNNHDFVPLTPFLIIPNMDLEAETSDSIELGSKFDNGTTQFYTAVFFQKFENFIDIKQVGMNAQGLYLKQYQNINGVETYGIELSVAHQLTQNWGLNAKAGYVDGKDGEGNYVRTLTPWEGNVELTYDNESFSAYSMVNWAQAMDRVPECATDIGLATECATTSGWATIDLGISYAFNGGLDISANVVNLLDKNYIRYQDVGGISDDAKGYSTEPGRYFTVNAKYEF